MVTVSEESVFPFPREKVWRLMELHMDDKVILEIHPDVLSSKQLSREGNSWVFERKTRSYGRTFDLKWRFELTPIELFRGDVIESTGGLAPGSYIENRYVDAGNSTKVITKGELTLLGVPSFTHRWFLGRTLGQMDVEDLRYLRLIKENLHS